MPEFSLAAAMSEERGTIEDVIEPFLIQQGMIARTPRGRLAMPAAYDHLDLLQQAADALVDSAAKFDVDALVEIFGPDGDDDPRRRRPQRRDVVLVEVAWDHVLEQERVVAAL